MESRSANDQCDSCNSGLLAWGSQSLVGHWTASCCGYYGLDSVLILGPGYFLDDDSRCRPFICKEDSGSCRRCLPQKLVWQSKMALSDTSRFKGLVGRGSSCLMFECHRLRSRRVAHGQCKRCNPGFELTQHKSCRPYSCRLGEATNCAECLEQPLRSGGLD